VFQIETRLYRRLAELELPGYTGDEIAAIAATMDEGTRAAFYLHYREVMSPGSTSLRPKTERARILEAAGYDTWLRTLGSRTFTSPLATFHREFWDWYWTVRQSLLMGVRRCDQTAVVVQGFGFEELPTLRYSCRYFCDLHAREQPRSTLHPLPDSGW
jgi:hypothetical protein